MSSSWIQISAINPFIFDLPKPFCAKGRLCRLINVNKLNQYLEKLEKVKLNYKRVFKEFSQNLLVIDGSKSINEIHNEIKERVINLYGIWRN